MNFSGFHTLSTTRHEGFTQQLMSEFEVIIQKYYAQPIYNSFSLFYDELIDHIANIHVSHTFDVNKFKDVLLNQLHQVYLEAGYTGTISDMVTSIVETIKIGSISDAKLGVRTDKALSCEGWKILFDKHRDNTDAHSAILNDMFNYSAFICEPLFSFSALSNELWDTYYSSGYSLNIWNKREGTLYLELLVNTDVHVTSPITVFNIQGAYDYLHVTYTDYTLNLLLQDAESNIGHILASIPLIENHGGMERLVCTYTKQHWKLYTVTTHDEVDVPTDLDPVNLHKFASFITSLEDQQPIGIRSITYYPKAATDRSLLYLLS